MRSAGRAVLVLERFLGVSTQTAAEITNALLTSRLRHFEATVCDDPSRLLDHLGIGPRERAAMLAYAKGLVDWQAGGHTWHLRSSRYLNRREGGPAGPRSAHPVRAAGADAHRRRPDDRPVPPQPHRGRHRPTAGRCGR
ncbi:hypothetical protein ACQEU3_39555 [Spirillospora sp. CA-253888]